MKERTISEVIKTYTEKDGGYNPDTLAILQALQVINHTLYYA